jgi:hypothetical protein
MPLLLEQLMVQVQGQQPNVLVQVVLLLQEQLAGA